VPACGRRFGPGAQRSSSAAVGAGLVASLAKPGGNITGFTSQQDEVLGKLIGILHEIVSGARRIAILLNESNPLHAAYWARAQGACAALDLVALRVVASTPAQIGAAVEQMVRQRSQAVVVTSDSMYFTERAKLQELMQTTRLPVAHALRDNVVAGGLLSYGYDAAANYRNAAKYVDRILKGAARGSSRRAGYQVRSGDQPQDREVARNHDSEGRSVTR